MYQDQRAGIVSGESKAVAMCENAVSRLMNVNDEREKVLYEISERLHALYNQRAPQSPAEPMPPTPLDSDFFSKIHRQIGRAEDDNSRLQRILNHLNQIVSQ
jgi:hypothetical protein